MAQCLGDPLDGAGVATVPAFEPPPTDRNRVLGPHLAEGRAAGREFADDALNGKR
jgi:hypothetical protein